MIIKEKKEKNLITIGELNEGEVFIPQNSENYYLKVSCYVFNAMMPTPKPIISDGKFEDFSVVANLKDGKLYLMKNYVKVIGCFNAIMTV